VLVIQGSEVHRTEAQNHFLYEMSHNYFPVFFKTYACFWSCEKFELREYFERHFARCPMMGSHWIRKREREREKRFMQRRYQLLTAHSVDGR